MFCQHWQSVRVEQTRTHTGQENKRTLRQATSAHTAGGPDRWFLSAVTTSLCRIGYHWGPKKYGTRRVCPLPSSHACHPDPPSAPSGYQRSPSCDQVHDALQQVLHPRTVGDQQHSGAERPLGRGRGGGAERGAPSPVTAEKRHTPDPGLNTGCGVRAKEDGASGGRPTGRQLGWSKQSVLGLIAGGSTGSGLHPHCTCPPTGGPHFVTAGAGESKLQPHPYGLLCVVGARQAVAYAGTMDLCRQQLSRVPKTCSQPTGTGRMTSPGLVGAELAPLMRQTPERWPQDVC